MCLKTKQNYLNGLCDLFNILEVLDLGLMQLSFDPMLPFKKNSVRNSPNDFEKVRRVIGNTTTFSIYHYLLILWQFLIGISFRVRKLLSHFHFSNNLEIFLWLLFVIYWLIEKWFLRGRSPSTNFVEFTSYAYGVGEFGSQLDVIYTAFSKAFDMVRHNVPLRKLHRLGIHCFLSDHNWHHQNGWTHGCWILCVEDWWSQVSIVETIDRKNASSLVFKEKRAIHAATPKSQIWADF